MRSRRTKAPRAIGSPANPLIDLGLAVAGAVLPPGKTRNREELAAWAGCTKQYIEQLEARALRKIRNALLFGTHRGLINADDVAGFFDQPVLPGKPVNTRPPRI